jgi:glycolate oxidase
MTDAYDALLDEPLPTVNRQRLVDGLRPIVGAAHLILDTEQLRPFECDGLPSIRSLPLCAVLPGSVDEVCAVMRLCYELEVPVVTRGAGTGLSGGATPCPGGLLLVLTRLNRVLDVDVPRSRARVEPGVRNLAISETVAEHGLYYAPDPSSQIACSIGGNVAENAGGVHCLKYGLTVHNILALKVVTVAGELLELSVDDPGPDLLAIYTGSEGMLGVVVEVTVKLLVSPPAVETLLVAFDSVQSASTAVGAIISAGIIPAGLEMMDRLALTAAEAFAGAGYPTDAAAILLVELDGCASEVQAETVRCEEVLLAAGASEVRRAVDAQQRALFWKGRKSAFPAVGRLYPDYYCMDGTIPRGAIGDVLAYIAQQSQAFKMPVANVFHAGDGNLHPLILFDANQPGELAKAEQLGALILEKCIAVGGTITGEHGVGREKINQMASQFSDAELEQLRRLKRAFDPPGTLNPGKVIPTLKRCQEYRAIGRNPGAR